MGKELFISYGREPEVNDFVLKLKGDLEKNGFRVWLDATDIPAGSDWHAAIGNGLHSCRALLAIITPKYVESRYCTSELYVADADKKLIFPIFRQKTDLGASEKARGVKYVISGINWTYCRPGDDYNEGFRRLVEGLRSQGLGGKKEHCDREPETTDKKASADKKHAKKEGAAKKPAKQPAQQMGMMPFPGMNPFGMMPAMVYGGMGGMPAGGKRH